MKESIEEYANSNKILTMNEAYDAMVDYLDKYCNRVHSEDLDCLLSGMYILESDGTSVDSAAQEDWKESIDKVLKQNFANKDLTIIKEQVNNSADKIKVLTLHEAYNAMIDYLEGFCERTSSDETRALLDGMHLLANEISASPVAFAEWKKSVDKILKQNPQIRPYFTLTR